ncbi:aspartate/glutamate/uridylate kinase [Methanoregula boonei 6A8]|uniref:Isopentenyl phosphate kinase n=1 Tax=Methanoregula boonei (strain DSM 21154 / JCM 14090 / 6A8) TaxID=456442 RepID=A7IAG5_METB6|nr:isopentenyl phosphate kinase [Methanoregula boonei]ABS56726.1 aspartate/glutamate/uridylate kinase [Methanoregula boonei 6A8]
MSERIILKLGGSVITDKGADCQVNKAALADVAAAIAGAPAAQIVVVHGAGSCGHPEARKYQLDRGATPGYTEGIGITHDAVSSLNTEVVAALRGAGIQALGVHPLHAGIADKGRLLTFETKNLETMLSLGMVPVIHGDVVMDLSRGACIVSGDQLVRYLAVALKCTRVGLATDVPGVLDGGRVVREITPQTVHTLQIGSSSHTDVTGGMKGKIDELLGLAAAGTESGIFSVSRLGDFLARKDHGGTTVREG